MNTNLELDGEQISIEQASPSDTRRTLDQDDFYPANGMRDRGDELAIGKMVVASAAQNTPNYFDQDNFYPADGVKKNVKDYLSPQERAKRKELRQSKRGAKTAEIQSRAELNKSIGQDKASDVEIAKALGGGDSKTPSTSTSSMSTTTKVLIGVGVVAVLGTIAYFVLKGKSGK
jgi:hypothetical protein